jgi:hypothetical protein
MNNLKPSPRNVSRKKDERTTNERRTNNVHPQDRQELLPQTEGTDRYICTPYNPMSAVTIGAYASTENASFLISYQNARKGPLLEELYDYSRSSSWDVHQRPGYIMFAYRI